MQSSKWKLNWKYRYYCKLRCFRISGAGVCHPCEDQSELGVGEYCVTVTDSNENTLETCFELEESDEIVTTSVIENPSCNELSGWPDGTIDIIVTGGSEIFEYNWSGPEISQGEEDQIGLGEGTYSVTVSDSEGCAAPPGVSFYQVEI